MEPANFNNIAYAQENLAERIRQTYSWHLLEERVVTKCEEKKPWNIWGSTFIEKAHQNSGHDQKKGYHQSVAGFTVALDYQWTQWLFTLGFSFASTDVDILKEKAEADFNTYAGTFGTLWTNGSWYADGLISYLFNAAHAHRHMEFSAPPFSFTEKLRASHSQDANQFLVHIGGGYDYTKKSCARNAFHFYPFANLDYTYVSLDGYTESGSGSLDLTVHHLKSDLLRPEIGIGASYIGCFQATHVTFDLAASYVHEFRFLGQRTKAHFKDDDSEFTLSGLFPQNNLFCPTARLKLMSPQSQIYIVLGYYGEYGVKFVENAGDLELGYAF